MTQKGIRGLARLKFEGGIPVAAWLTSEREIALLTHSTVLEFTRLPACLLPTGRPKEVPNRHLV